MHSFNVVIRMNHSCLFIVCPSLQQSYMVHMHNGVIMDMSGANSPIGSS